MECNACTTASQPMSWLAHSWADPTDEIKSSHRADKNYFTSYKPMFFRYTSILQSRNFVQRNQSACQEYF